MSRNEELLQAIIDGEGSSDLSPAQSRNERILHAIIDDEDLSKLPTPQSPIESLLIQVGEKIQQGGLSTEPLSVSANGTYTAPSGKAYTPVTVNVTPSLQQKTATENGVVTPDTGYDGLSQVTVNVSGGGGSVPEKDVNFYDYDGTCVAAYTAAEFAALSEMPANPDRTSEGLTAQGWNWSLADAKAYVASYGMLNVGQMYITTDGKTHIHIHLEEGRTSPMLGCYPNGTVDVDWGDGSTHDTLTGTSIETVKWTSTHNYAAPGDYVIKLTVTGSMGLYGSTSSNMYSGLLRHSKVSDVRNKHYNCAIRKVEIGNNVTSIDSGAFNNCNSLTAVTIPSSVTSINGSAFNNCYSLAVVTIPSGITTISGSMFYNCHGMTAVAIPNEVTSINASALSGCGCLAAVAIPNGVTSIGNSAFYDCISLTAVTIPSAVTTIGTNAFAYCGGLAVIHFKPTTPPTLAASSAFSNLPTDCKIYVPTGSLSAYTGATNYPSSSTYTYIEE